MPSTPEEKKALARDLLTAVRLQRIREMHVLRDEDRVQLEIALRNLQRIRAADMVELIVRSADRLVAELMAYHNRY